MGFRVDANFSINGGRDREFNITLSNVQQAMRYRLPYSRSVIQIFKDVVVAFHGEKIEVKMDPTGFREPSSEMEKLLTKVAQGIGRALWVQATTFGEYLTRDEVPDDYMVQLPNLLERNG